MTQCTWHAQGMYSCHCSPSPTHLCLPPPSLQGLGRLPEREVLARVDQALAGFSRLLAASQPGPFLFGEAPCGADAALFGALDQYAYSGGLNWQLREAVHKYPDLVGG